MNTFSHRVPVVAALLVCCTFAPADDLRDPTVLAKFEQPAPEVSTPSSPLAGTLLRLSYIRIAPDVRHAVINDRLVREGDELEGVTVKRITPQRVQVERDGELRELRLYVNALRASETASQTGGSTPRKSGREK